jgi:hypothetical protein
MQTATRLAAYGAGLAVVFGGAFVAADAVVPQDTADSWTEEAKGHDMGTDSSGHGANPAAHTAVPGVTSAQSGYLLSPVSAPTATGEPGTLSFRISDADGDAVTRFATSHEKRLHLIVVRTDGTQFRHVHPTMADDGTWSLPWQWAEAGTYRVYADFVPQAESAEADTITLTRTVEVAGQFAPASPAPTRVASVDGYTVELTGDLKVGSSSGLTFTASKDGEPVTTLQPYLGAFGHLVALRDGDLAYLHVHPEGEEPQAGETSGPKIGFAAHAPTPGRYLLYLDFQVGGKVHSAPFVVDTDDAPAQRETDTHAESDGAGHGH